MDEDTDIGGTGNRFPPTRGSAILAARSQDQAERTRGLETLAASYWKPVYKYIRLHWGKPNEDAKDLTQGFFHRAIEKNFFQGYDPSKAAFRTYLRTCVDGFVAKEDKFSRRIKRGGEAQLLSLDFDSAEGELGRSEIPDPEDMEEYFHKEWVRSLFGLAVERLREECEASGKGIQFRLFERYDLEEGAAPGPLTYEQLGAEYGLPATTVTNYLAFARRAFRRVVLEKLRELTASDEEFRAEARRLLGVDAR